MPDSTLSEVIKEAYAVSPSDVVLYHTLEIHHVSFATPIRVVRDFENIDAFLENTAPASPGEEVTFIGYAFELVPPDVSVGPSPTLTIEIDNVSREILASIEAAMATPDLLTVIYRAYASDDLTQPTNLPPMQLTIFSINATPMRIRALAGFLDISNKRFPAGEYTAERFPALTQQ